MAVSQNSPCPLCCLLGKQNGFVFGPNSVYLKSESMGPRDESFDPVSPDLWLEGAGLLRAAELTWWVWRDSAQRCLPETCVSRHAAGRQASRTPLEALLSLRSVSLRSLHSLSQKAPSHWQSRVHSFRLCLDIWNHSCLSWLSGRGNGFTATLIWC